MSYNDQIGRSDASALMPEEVSNKFLTNLSAKSAVLQSFTEIPVNRAQVRIPILSGLPQAYWVNPTDTGMKQTSNAKWKNKFLNIEEIAVIVPIPDNVISDADQPIWERVMPLAEGAAARTFDQTVYFGVNAPASFGTAVFTAATAHGNVGTIGTNAAATGGIVGDQSDLLSKLELQGFDPRSGIASRTLKGKARQARNTQGERFGEIKINQDDIELDGVSYTFPMRGQFTGIGGTAHPLAALLYDPTEFVFGLREDVTWKLLDQAVITDSSGSIVYNLPQQDMTALRLTMRLGWEVANVINYDQPDESLRYPAGALLS